MASVDSLVSFHLSDESDDCDTILKICPEISEVIHIRRVTGYRKTSHWLNKKSLKIGTFSENFPFFRLKIFIFGGRLFSPKTENVTVEDILDEIFDWKKAGTNLTSKIWLKSIANITFLDIL